MPADLSTYSQAKTSEAEGIATRTSFTIEAVSSVCHSFIPVYWLLLDSCSAVEKRQCSYEMAENEVMLPLWILPNPQWEVQMWPQSTLFACLPRSFTRRGLALQSSNSRLVSQQKTHKRDIYSVEWCIDLSQFMSRKAGFVGFTCFACVLQYLEFFFEKLHKRW